jgi:hypothetical protein
MYAIYCRFFSGFNVTKPGLSFAAAFKSAPYISNPDYFSARRPLFVGACSSCTTHSGATLVNFELTSLLPIKNALAPTSIIPNKPDDDEVEVKMGKLLST